MIIPENITNYNRTQAELEEFLLFAIIVAGKTAKTQADKLNMFLWTAQITKVSPFAWLKYLIDFEDQSCFNSTLVESLKHYKLGQYNRIEKAFRGILQFEGRLDSVSLDELESVEGIGPKTARFFILHSRPDQQVACLDTHILKWMGSKGYKVPKTTPSKKKYKQIESDFLHECHKVGKKVADMDLEIWKSYAK